MDNSQTPLDYKEYFSNKFVTLFKNIISLIVTLLPDNSKEKLNILKIQNLVEKLNYEKIIKKMQENKKLIEVILILTKNDFSEELSNKLLLSNEKYWSIVPSFNLNEILLKITELEERKEICNKINDLHICAVTYENVIEQINQTKEGGEFNPFSTIGNVAENMDINTLFSGVEVKNISAYEMLMESIINQQMDNKMGDYMNNIKEDDVNEAASKLNDVLNSDSFQGNKQTSKILSDMLSNIKSEVINLKQDGGSNLKGKQGVESLLGIAQKVAGSMMSTIKESNVSVLDIWDATSSLAKNTVQSDALNIVDNLIRTNIEANMGTVKKAEENIKLYEDLKKESNENNEKKSKKNKRKEKII